MKKSLLIALVALCMASTAFAEGGMIGIFADMEGTNCSVVLPAYGPIYLVHIGSDGTTGSGGRALKPSPCAAGVIIAGDVGNFPTYVSNDPAGGLPSQTGWSIGYGDCQTSGTVLIATLNVLGGTITGCCAWSVTEDERLEGPDGNPSTTPISTDCTPNAIIETVVGLTSQTFTAPSTPEDCPCSIIPVQESTWGGVKELFRKGI